MSNRANNVSATLRDNKEVILYFDYLDHQQGFKVSCLHTGKNTDLSVDGTIKGIGMPRDAAKSSALEDIFLFATIVGTNLLVAGLGIAIGLGIVYYFNDYLNSFSKAIIIVGIAFLTMGAILPRLDRPNFLNGKRRVPHFESAVE
ncbi:hypothetical protein G6M70_18920 [Agrobacterium tumefaciens]|uniref:hypothetical protein n=1 Tax=Agrobacterium tumefaciens TaxID=358 RepID=UPI001574E537|nr:hypothetical protein [Agrobacterium tumefaciens]NSZ01585.1 hypothetical protein [Agrobacterium tumefaciens]NSZ39029.1 hypothetical protein [Agrobacterium tumefaciens]NTB23109.1 hypothetical protein [Agrobacterium tumefaciens]NTB28759.1 hypothetical protein [Agrobacterium tumefaciens]NTB32885.1 hypothetical protein [Agrobacterium tumefaciens]